MKTLRAEYVGELDRKDGLGYYQCGICGDVVFELDLQRHEPEMGEGLIECCVACLENFESDEEVEIGSDLIAPQLFEMFWRWAELNRSALTEHSAV